MSNKSKPEAKRPEYFWLNLYNAKEIKKINKICEKNFMTGADIPPDGVVKVSKVYQVPWGPIKQSLNRWYQSMMHVNFLAFGMNIYPLWDGYELFYNIYNPSKEKDVPQFGWHTDGLTTVNPVSDYKLTSVINLSEEPVEGGDFILGGVTETVTKLSLPGHAVIFPSSRLHKVTPILKGTRRSLIIWLPGPKLT